MDPAGVVEAMWSALYARDWDRLRGFFADESIYFDVPTGPGVRVDTHVYAGYTVPPYYDSLLAKLICQGRDRAEAITRMRVALESFIIEGVTTTAPFLSRVMMHPSFQSGDVDTKFLEREGQLMKEPS